jgi:hypothetical protein
MPFTFWLGEDGDIDDWLFRIGEVRCDSGYSIPRTEHSMTFIDQHTVLQELLKQRGHMVVVIGSEDFHIHDFGTRGASSEESDEIGGVAHLMNLQARGLEAIHMREMPDIKAIFSNIPLRLDHEKRPTKAEWRKSLKGPTKC